VILRLLATSPAALREPRVLWFLYGFSFDQIMDPTQLEMSGPFPISYPEAIVAPEFFGT